jgi:hypothetical protein
MVETSQYIVWKRKVLSCVNVQCMSDEDEATHYCDMVSAYNSHIRKHSSICRYGNVPNAGQSVCIIR